MSPINKKLFQNSLRQVRRELKTLGFGTKQIMETKVSRTILPSIAKGLFTEYGEIFIPILQSKKGGVRDTLRHEYGHAILHYHPKIMYRKRFHCFRQTTDRDDFVSKYAMKNNHEDFCETFMVYLKHKGKLPQRYSSPRLMKKWRFINGLRNRLHSS